METLPTQQKYKPIILLTFFLTFFSFKCFSFEIEEVAKNFFVHYGKQEDANEKNKGDISNLGFIIGENSVLVIDTGGTLEIAEKLIKAIESKTNLPISHVIITHGHPDHFLGSHAFSKFNPIFVGHENLERSLNMNFNFYRALQATSIKNKQILNIPPILPDLKIKKNETYIINIGNRLIEVRSWQSGHTDNDLSVVDKMSKIMWSENIFVERIPSIRASVLGWKKNLNHTLSMDILKIVPGHGKIKNKEEAILPMIRYFDSLIDEIRFSHKNGETIENVLTKSEKVRKLNWKLFNEYHKTNVIKVYSELEWE